MTTSTGPNTAPPGKNASADELETDIERTREDLGNTVDELTAKLDVKAQAQHKVQDVKHRATEQAHTAQVRVGQAAARAKETARDDQGKVKPAFPVGAAVLVAAVIALVVWRWRR